MKNDEGRKFGDLVEAQCQAALQTLMSKHGCWFQRLYDTRAAGAFLPESPADFVGVANGHGFLLEAKGSVALSTFSEGFRKLMKPHQALHGYLIDKAGGDGLVIFVSKPAQVVELWDSSKVRQVYVTPRARLTTEALISNAFIPQLTDISECVKGLILDYYQNRRSKWKAQGY